MLETATDEEIKKEYRSLAKKYHPDVYKEADAEQRFLEIQKAYTMIKDQGSRDKNRITQDLGDMMDGIDLDAVSETERDVIVSILNRLRDKRSTIGGWVPASMVYEVSLMKNRGSEFFYTANSVTEMLPHYLAMVGRQPWFDEPEKDISFLLFSRLEAQNALGKIQYLRDEKKMVWNSQDDRLIASANICDEKKTAWMTTQSWMVRSRGKVMGTFTSRYYNLLPLFSYAAVIPAAPDAPLLVGRRICFFGTHITWYNPNAKAVCIASRGAVSHSPSSPLAFRLTRGLSSGRHWVESSTLISPLTMKTFTLLSTSSASPKATQSTAGSLGSLL